MNTHPSGSVREVLITASFSGPAMYKTCMFCKRPLGENQVVEHFPVGRRLAFDAELRRL